MTTRLPAHNLEPDAATNSVLTTVGTAAAWAAPTYREVLMTDGVTAPPEPVWCEDGSDWLYSEVIR